MKTKMVDFAEVMFNIKLPKTMAITAQSAWLRKKKAILNRHLDQLHNEFNQDGFDVDVEMRICKYASGDKFPNG